MRHRRIKKVITKKGKILYYLGDGLWFGRISKDRAEKGLDSGKYILFITVDKRELKEIDPKFIFEEHKTIQ